uniref:C2H2-type domain-containing protein n=1 Tax=Panagrolaimus sp. PS1159 TaxID=55785 RepID=A0AC35FT14_9BILA
MSSLQSHLLDDHKITSDVAKKLMATNGIGNENDSSSVQSTSPIYKYHCKLCPMIFRTNDGYQTHSLKHIFTSTHKCTRCNRSFKSVQSLRNHMTNKHEISSFDSTNDNSCSICPESFPDRQTLQTHIYSIEHLHKAKKILEQQSTGKLGQQLNEQVMSLLSKIPKNGTNESQNTTKKPYKCNICRLSYGQGSTLDTHLRSVAHQTRIGRLSELVASGEVDACLPVSEQPGGIAQKTIGELILPSTTSELEMVGFPF